MSEHRIAVVVNGHTQQATALYRCLDVLDWIESTRDFPD